DYELRAADHGFRVRFVPAARATHVGGDSQVRPEFWAHLVANRVRLYGMRHTRLAAWLFWAATVTNELLRLRSRPATRPAALSKLWREGRALVAGSPPRRPAGYCPPLTHSGARRPARRAVCQRSRRPATNAASQRPRRSPATDRAGDRGAS